MSYQGKFSNNIKKGKGKSRIIKLIGVVATLLVIIGCWFHFKSDSSNTNNAELFSEMYTSAITIENTIWPEDGVQGNAQVFVSLPDLEVAYQMAISDSKNNGENTIKLMMEYLEDSSTEIQIDVQAEKVNENWEIDLAHLNQSVAKYTADRVDTFLNKAFSDLEPLEININMEGIQ